MKKIIIFLLLSTVFLSAGLVFIYQSELNYQIAEDIEVSVTKGEGFYIILRKIRKKDPKISFAAAKMYLKINGLDKALKAGEYAFSRGNTLRDLIQDFSMGRVVTYKILIPEGYNVFEIADLLLEKEIISSKDKFLKIVRSREEAFKYLGYAAKSLEGYLYPATYAFSKKTKEHIIVKSLVKTHQNNFKSLMKEVSLPKGFTHHQLITLASIVEKETGASHERALIASVFWNRLKKKMRLQSDPTTIYGQWVKTGKRLLNIRKKHLLEKNDYNTYSIKALPAGPISNPGYEALKAVCRPAQTNYLYFVSKNNGTHYFSKTYQEHAAAVRKFQMSRKARKGKSWRNLKKR